MAGVVKYPIKEPTSDTTDNLSEAAELAWGHLTDSPSPDTIKAQVHFLKGEYSHTPLLGLCVEIPPWRGGSPPGYLLRLKREIYSHLCVDEHHQPLLKN